MLRLMARTADATLITSAPRHRSLDVEERQRRYLVTMGLRTLCFLAFLVVPGWWKLVALAGAALLPAVAVLLANNIDRRPPPPLPPVPEPSTAQAITTGEVLRGSFEEHT